LFLLINASGCVGLVYPEHKRILKNLKKLENQNYQQNEVIVIDSKVKQTNQ